MTPLIGRKYGDHLHERFGGHRVTLCGHRLWLMLNPKHYEGLPGNHLKLRAVITTEWLAYLTLPLSSDSNLIAEKGIWENTHHSAFVYFRTTLVLSKQTVHAWKDPCNWKWQMSKNCGSGLFLGIPPLPPSLIFLAKGHIPLETSCPANNPLVLFHVPVQELAYKSHFIFKELEGKDL